MNNRSGSPDELSPSPPNDRRLPRRGPLGCLAVLLACLAVSLAVHAPYVSAFPTNDDIYLQLEIGYVATGRMPLLDFIRRDYNGQLFPLSKLLYYAAWRAFGLDVRPAHLAVLAFHALGAFGLFQLLRRLSVDARAATAGALLWSSAALGRWDNPLVWLCAGTIVGGLMWLTVALAAAASSADPARRHGHDRRFSGVLVSSSAALASWSVMALLMPLVPWLRRLALRAGASAAVPLDASAPRAVPPTTAPPANGGQSSRLWHLSWLVPLVVFGLWQTLVARGAVPATLGGDKIVPASHCLDALVRALMLLGQSLVGLLLGGADWNLPLAIGAGAALAAIVLIATRRADIAPRRSAWLLLFGAAVYLFVAACVRHDVARHEMLAWGRYRYVPTWAWSAAVAVALGPWLARGGAARRRAFTALGILLLAAIAARQYRIARATAADFARLRGPYHDVYRAQERMLTHLITVAAERRRPLRLPQIPLDLPPVRGVQFPLSNFIALHYPRGTPHVQVVVAEELEPVDVQDALAVLHASGNPRAAQWATVLREVVTLWRLVEWLDRLARESGEPVVFPRDWTITFSAPFSSGPWSVPLAQLISDGFQQPPSGIVFADTGGGRRGEQLRRIESRLHGNPAPEARAWLQMLGAP